MHHRRGRVSRKTKRSKVLKDSGLCWWMSLSLVGSGARLILVSPERSIVKYALCFEFPTTNNEVEYEALTIGLKMEK